MRNVEKLVQLNKIDETFSQYVNKINNSNEKIDSEEMKIYVQINKLLIEANKCIIKQIEINGEN
jgi:Spy/CpxP family protein refolding chaperone